MAFTRQPSRRSAGWRTSMSGFASGGLINSTTVRKPMLGDFTQSSISLPPPYRQDQVGSCMSDAASVKGRKTGREGLLIRKAKAALETPYFGRPPPSGKEAPGVSIYGNVPQNFSAFSKWTIAANISALARSRLAFGVAFSCDPSSKTPSKGRSAFLLSL